jgi:hypothetical protein
VPAMVAQWIPRWSVLIRHPVYAVAWCRPKMGTQNVEQANDNAPPVCSRCENAMQRIGKMPRFGLHPAFHVFRCDGCKVVSSQVIPSN